MKQNTKFYRREDLNELNTKPYKRYLLILIVILTPFLCVNLISAIPDLFQFDNIETYDKDVGDYGKYTIRNSVLGIPFLQLDKIIEIELKNNTDYCEGYDCYAIKEMILYEDGVLIEDIRFLYIKQNGERYYQNLKHRLYIKNNNKWIPYSLNEKVSKGTYEVKLEGTLPDMWTTVDWQIKSKGTWTTNWAEWTSNLNTDLLMYLNMTKAGTTITDLTDNGRDGTVVGSVTEVDGIINKAQRDASWDAASLVNITDNKGIEGLERNFSVNFWFNSSIQSSNAVGVIDFDYEDQTDGGGFSIKLVGTNMTAGTGTAKDMPVNVTNNSWHMITAIVNDTSIIWYHNGVKNATFTADASYVGDSYFGIGGDSQTALSGGSMIDEVGIWNRTLTQSEITALFNDGNALNFKPLDVLVTLLNPIDNNQTFSRNIMFSSNITSSGGTLQNATLQLWFSNGTKLTNFTTISGSSNITNLSLSNLDLDTYQWNYEGCSDAINDPCQNASDNFTLTISNFIENSQTFNNLTTEGSVETFVLNISYDGSTFTNANANLVYNGTSQSSTRTGTGDKAVFTTSVNIPTIDAEVNVSFNWLVELSSPTITSSSNSTSNNQTIRNITIDDCSVNGATILNLTLRDEQTQDLIVGATFNTSIEIDLQIYSVGDRGDSIVNFSGNFSENNNPEICLSNLNASYEMDARILYDADDYAAEFYNIQNFSLSNTTAPLNISLFDLKDSVATQFLITYKDENFIPVQNALIQIQRQYISEGVFKAVEIPNTDEEGSATASFQLTGVVYTIIVVKQGEVLSTFNDVSVYCDDKVIEDCRINLNALSSGVPFTDWEETGGITFTESFDKDTRTITTIFSSTDGTPKTVLLEATKFDRFLNETVCSNSLSTASGTLVCTIPESFGNVTVKSELSVAGDIISTSAYIISMSAYEAFGTDAIILLLLMILILPMMLVSSTIGLILGVIIGLTLGAFFTLYNLDSMIGPLSSLLWITIAGGIIIWKIVTRRE